MQTELQTSHILFGQIYDFVVQHPQIPRGGDKTFREYKNLYLELTKDIPKIPGWYAWIKKDNSITKPIYIYIGQTHLGSSANLRARIEEELQDEFVAFWVTKYDPIEVLYVLDAKYKGKYTRRQLISARKAGSTHIVWVGKNRVSRDELNQIEYRLIQKYDPKANIKKQSYRGSYPELFEQIEQCLELEISRIN